MYVILQMTIHFMSAIEWFRVNGLSANPDKFQLVFLGDEKFFDKSMSIYVGSTKLKVKNFSV